MGVSFALGQSYGDPETNELILRDMGTVSNYVIQPSNA